MIMSPHRLISGHFYDPGSLQGAHWRTVLGSNRKESRLISVSPSYQAETVCRPHALFTLTMLVDTMYWQGLHLDTLHVAAKASA